MSQNITCETRKVADIVWRQDLYPRFNPNPVTIQQYAESIDMLPPIEINQHNELIDGYHRWTAHKKADVDTIQVIVTQTASDREFLLLAIKRNSVHGLQLSNEEKKSQVLALYTGKDSEKAEFAALFSVSERTIDRWTARRDKDMKEQRNKRIADLWLACWTRDEIAAEMGVSAGYVSELMEKPSENDTWRNMTVLSEYREPDWAPPLYNVWKRQEKTNGTSHFGNSEATWVDNLLYLYTEPFDIVCDPFGGGGSTIDVCKRRLRRYWVSDRKPIVERPDVRTWDITQGPPSLHKRWSDVAMLYLDPPYWKQAAGKYSKDAQDLANMSLDDFYAVLNTFVKACADKMRPGSYIALIIQPTQWKNEDKSITDHVFDLCQLLTSDKLKLDARISCPYESQQYNAQQVEWAKANRKVLVLTRELIVWQVQ